MNEYIYIEDRIAILEKQMEFLQEDINTIKKGTEENNTEEFVRVVRCKDCKYRYGEDGEYNPNDLVCTYWESDGLTERDFCSQGEPRR